jgi:hypothetical protein
MCEPTTIALASLAISGVSAVAQSAAAVQTAKAKNTQAVKNAELANDSYLLKMRQENQRVYETDVQANQKKEAADRKTEKAKARAIAIASGAGVQGKNVGELTADFERAEAIYDDRLSAQVEGRRRQSELNKLGFQSEALGRINQVQPVGFAETLFAASEPLASFGLEYADYKSRLDSI